MKKRILTILLLSIAVVSKAQYFWNGDATSIYYNGKVAIGLNAPHVPYVATSLHIKSPSATPWGFLTEASGSDRVIAVGHDGTAGYVSTSYLTANGAHSPLYLRTSNLVRLAISTAGNIGISTTDPKARLHIPNGDIIVGGADGLVNNINATLFVKSKADNSATYPFYVGKSTTGTDLFWVRGDGNGYLLGQFGIGGSADASNNLQIVAANNPTLAIGKNGVNTTGKSTLAFYAGDNTHFNSFKILYNKTSTTDRLGFVDGNEIEVFSLKNGGNIGIGITDPDHKLTVNGAIRCEEVKVEIIPETGPDYVFEKDYDLLSLEALEAYINKNKHLPEVPSAKEMEANGLNLREMNLLLLKKVEELTLYMIELKKENEMQSKEIEKLKRR